MDAIAAIVARLSPTADVQSVIARLEAIETERDGFFAPPPDPAARAQREPRPDGVACFNGMYLSVTQKVADALHVDFERPDFIHRLDVVFAEFYFEAVKAQADHAWCSRAWAPLFELCRERRVLPLQFAVAGMNAHINNDLTFALVQTWHEQGLTGDQDTPEYRDFQKVNGLLEQVEKDIKGPLLDPFVADVDHVLGQVDDKLAMWSVAQARDDAWDRAQELREHPDRIYDAFHDRLIGLAGRLLLSPLLP
jgi:hypothetical protein